MGRHATGMQTSAPGLKLRELLMLEPARVVIQDIVHFGACVKGE